MRRGKEKKEKTLEMTGWFTGKLYCVLLCPSFNYLSDTLKRKIKDKFAKDVGQAESYIYRHQREII